MRHGSLFSGVGGFDLAAEWMGWENVFHCEKNDFCNQVLNYYWPNAKTYTDITTTDFTIWDGLVDVLTGGFPCQPFSVAGSRKGKSDVNYLWPQMLRAIREIRPGWIVGENVPGIVNWSKGLVFYELQTQMEAEGFEVFPPINLPACGVGAPHRRERIWFVAYSESNRSNGLRRLGESGFETYKSVGEKEQRERVWHDARRDAQAETSSDSLFNNGEKIQIKKRESIIRSKLISIDEARGNRGWSDWPTQHPVSNGNDGLSSKLDGIAFSKWRQETIKAGGNAVVPEIPYQIFKAIEQFEKIA